MKLEIPTKAQSFYAPLWVPNEWVAQTLLSSMFTHCPFWLHSYVTGACSCRQTGNRSKVEGHISNNNSTSHAITFLSLCPAKAAADQIKFQTMSACVDQRYILKPWLLNAKPSLSHEHKEKMNWKKYEINHYVHPSICHHVTFWKGKKFT